jgi:hypothetical protein
MGLKDALVHTATDIFVERPGRTKTLDQWAATLEKSGAAIDRRAAATKDPARAQVVLRHCTGIERWGQRRLRVLLGAPLVRDEYDNYRPGTDLSLDGQRSAFGETRQETIELVRALQEARVAESATVLHNEFGPLTARGWLQYLNMHANLECKKFR